LQRIEYGVNIYPTQVSINMPNSRARTPAALLKRQNIQKAYISNNNRAKTPRKNSARGTRRSQKSISQDKKIDQTIVNIGEAIRKLNSQLSEFVTKTYLNTRLAELEQKTLNRFGESESQRLQNQLNTIQQPRKTFQRQASSDSGFSFASADLFEHRSPANKNKLT